MRIQAHHNFRLLLLFIILLLLIISCGIATKRDLQTLREDIKETIRDEVRAGADEQKELEQRQSAKIDQVVATVNEPRGLAAMFASDPVRTWYGIEFLLFGGFSFAAALRLRHKSRMTDMAGDDYKIVAFARKLLNTVGARRKPDPPEPPDGKPPLRVVK